MCNTNNGKLLVLRDNMSHCQIKKGQKCGNDYTSTKQIVVMTSGVISDMEIALTKSTHMKDSKNTF